MFLAAALAIVIGVQYPYESDIRKFEAEDAKHPPVKGGIVVIGSSSVVRWTSIDKDFPGYNIVRRGFGGSQISDSVRYAHRIVTPYEPKMVFLFAGTNDIAAGKSAEVVFQDYKMFVERVREKLPSVTIVFISMSPAPSRWQYVSRMRKANDMIHQYCRDHSGLLYVNTFPKMIDPEGLPRTELFVEDRLHLSPKGYAICRDLIRPILAKQPDLDRHGSKATKSRRRSHL